MNTTIKKTGYFLTGLLLAVVGFSGCTANEVTIVDRPSVEATNSYYKGNLQPLLPDHFIKLPVGKVKPTGWLKRYLELQRDGLTGQLGEISAWLQKDKNAWLSPDGKGEYGWEEVPYWLKGFANLGYILNDPKIIAESKIWIEGVLNSQREDGYFGPWIEKRGRPDLWGNMIMLWCLQSYYEYSGDARVLPFMTKYFEWELALPDELFLKDYWENSRGGDNLYSVYWLYNRTGDARLLQLAEKVHRNTANWRQSARLPNWHNVNIAQCFREPATWWLQSKDSADLRATYNDFWLVRRAFGQASGGMFGADENARQGHIDPHQGTETCGFVEQMSSDEMLLRYTGDPMWAEHCENVAFNSYPAAVMPDFKSLRYITSPNHVISDSENHRPGIDNSGPFLAMNPFSSRCCQHNHTQGWPYFVENLVLATPDNGIAAAIYGACEAIVKVGNGAEIAVIEDTHYPFDDQIRFTVNTSAPVQFPFYLRIPSWTKKAQLKINGKAISATLEAGKYACIQREWANGDVVTLTVPMDFSMQTWQVNQNSVSVNYGPLTLSLNIKEEYKKIDSKKSAIGDSKWQETADPEKWPSYEIYPTSAWNYALVLNEKQPFQHLKVEKRAWPADDFPFTQQNSPLVVHAKGRQVPSWTIDEHGLCGVLPTPDCVKSSKVEDIELVPMGTARLRITSFPVAYKK
ncbi:hypothetical protein SAMD00024442_14_21 [Candidatus Symbiothrix dinenymphae]|nr:hypothetical protein SAMD00024442_14_21 [Candidatus Symbiothrix dinenymphae]